MALAKPDRAQRILAAHRAQLGSTRNGANATFSLTQLGWVNIAPCDHTVCSGPTTTIRRSKTSGPQRMKNGAIATGR